MESALADITPEEYQYIVGNLGQSLESGAIEQDDFGRTLAEIAAVVLLILFLRGAGKTAIKLSAEERRLIDATYGRRTRAVIISDSDHVILSAVQPETIAHRFDIRDNTTIVEEEEP